MIREGAGEARSRMAESSHKRIVITGATRGLGRALAEGFARLGHTVIGCGRDAGAIEVLRGPRELSKNNLNTLS